MSQHAALSRIGQTLVARRREITEEWRHRIAALPELGKLTPSAVVDHMPEFLHELAWASTGCAEAARRAFERIVTGHALQRLGFGVPLSTLLEEYAVLRQVILAELLRAVPGEGVRDELLELERTLDLAIVESVRTFAARREQVREQFIAVLAHDLRGPLQAVRAAADTILLQPCAAPAHARSATVIRRSAERMNRLIADFADFALGQLGGGIPSVPVTCDMGEICREVVDEVRTAHAGRAIAVEAAGDLAGSWDRDRLVQAIGNLVSNALVHGADPVTIRAFEEPDHQAVTTEVHNAGPPIPEELMPNLFDAFRRGKAAPSGGLGLGLFIVQHIALAHGAECRVRSSEHHGTTFSIRWPRAPLTEVPRPYQPKA
jgi:signal transduction histidine kinase